MAAAAMLAVVVAMQALGAEGREAAFQALFPPSGTAKARAFPVIFTLVRLASINAGMAAFNLDPPAAARRRADRSSPAAARLGRAACRRPPLRLYDRGSGRGGPPCRWLTFILGMVINFS